MHAAMLLADWLTFSQERGETSGRPDREQRKASVNESSVWRAESSSVKPEDPGVALVPAIRAGDAAAFRTLFDEYVDRLTDFAYTLIRDRAAAQDIVADVFFALWRGHTDWQPERVATYLFGAVRNRCYNHRASIVARREMGLGDIDPRADMVPGDTVAMTDSNLDAQALMGRIEEVLATMPPQRRAAALLRWREELSFTEISTVLKISENAARLHVTRALRDVRHLVPGLR